MCMSGPDMPEAPDPKPAPPPPAPKTVAEKQSAPEKPDKAKGKKDRVSRDSLRIPKNQSKGLNLPGSNQ